MDHHAIVAQVWEGRRGWLKQYRRMRQKYLLSLPMGPKDTNTTIFDALAAKYIKPKPKQALGKEWISERRWKMIAKWSSLLQSGQIQQTAVMMRMQHKVRATSKADKQQLTDDIGNMIVSEL